MKSLSLSLLIAAGLLSSAVSANADTSYAGVTINGHVYTITNFSNLNNADLHNAILTDGNFGHATFNGANLSGADLTGTNLGFSSFVNANLQNTVLDATFMWDTDFSGANLQSSSFSGVWGTGLVFTSSTNLLNVNFSNSFIYNTSFTGINLTGVNFSGTDLSGTDFTGATLAYANRAAFEATSGAVLAEAVGLDAAIYSGNTPVPEPSTYGLIGIGALAVAIAARRRKLKTA